MLLELMASLVVVADPPSALSQLVSEARVAARSRPYKSGIPNALDLKAQAIVAFGAKAIPLTVPLLADRSPGVREFFGYVVRDLPGLTTHELPALIAAYQRGNAWVAPAIASVQSPEADAFLIQELARTPQRQTQLTFALTRLGGRGAKGLASSLRGQRRVHPRFTEAACEVLRAIKEPAVQAGPDLVEVLSDANEPASTRIAALELLICVPAQAVSPQTRETIDTLIQSSPELAREGHVGELQISLGTPAGIASALRRLVEHPDEVARLAVAGQAGRVAEPAVLGVLDNESAEVRLEAIATLGAIGGERSVARLGELLSDVRDWRAPCSAARALATLRATQTANAIRVAANTAWYPPTADCLTSAAESLEQGVVPAQETLRTPHGRSFMLTPAPAPTVSPDELEERARRKLSVKGVIKSWSETGLHRQNTSAVPLVALRVDGGVLAGTDRGEWGGELVLLRPQAAQLVLLEENIVGIHLVGSQIVVVTGLAHLGLSSGALHRVARGSDGGLRATEWRILPGAPTSSFVLPNGRLFVRCSGGDVLVADDGMMSLAALALTP